MNGHPASASPTTRSAGADDDDASAPPAASTIEHDPVYRKTAAGLDEMQARRRGLPRKTFSLLLAVDGQCTRSQLARRLSAFGDVAAQLDTLVELGLIADPQSPTQPDTHTHTHTQTHTQTQTQTAMRTHPPGQTPAAPTTVRPPAWTSADPEPQPDPRTVRRTGTRGQVRPASPPAADRGRPAETSDAEGRRDDPLAVDAADAADAADSGRRERRSRRGHDDAHPDRPRRRRTDAGSTADTPTPRRRKRSSPGDLADSSGPPADDVTGGTGGTATPAASTAPPASDPPPDESIPPKAGAKRRLGPMPVALPKSPPPAPDRAAEPAPAPRPRASEAPPWTDGTEVLIDINAYDIPRDDDAGLVKAQTLMHDALSPTGLRYLDLRVAIEHCHRASQLHALLPEYLRAMSTVLDAPTLRGHVVALLGLIGARQRRTKR